jgi:adenine-specific DNA glycosylase
MRAFTFIMFLCLLCSLSGYAAREKGEIMLFPKSERAVAKSEKKYLEFYRNLNKGVLNSKRKSNGLRGRLQRWGSWEKEAGKQGMERLRS